MAEVEVPKSTRPRESTVKRFAPVEDARERRDLVVVPTTVSEDAGEVVPIPKAPKVVSEALTLPAVMILRALLSVVPSMAVAANALPDCTKALIDEVEMTPDTVEVINPVEDEYDIALVTAPPPVDPSTSTRLPEASTDNTLAAALVVVAEAEVMLANLIPEAVPLLPENVEVA